MKSKKKKKHPIINPLIKYGFIKGLFFFAISWLIFITAYALLVHIFAWESHSAAIAASLIFLLHLATGIIENEIKIEKLRYLLIKMKEDHSD